MKDGLYQVTTKYLCAGFIVKSGKVIACAPILKRKIEYWKTIAKLIPDNNMIKLVECTQPMTNCTMGNVYSAETMQNPQGDIVLVILCDDGGYSFVTPLCVTRGAYFKDIECLELDLRTFIEFEMLLCEDLAK